MAKKIVRGITDVKTITNQDFDTNNVNDLLSDGQYNYIHRKKGENEEYHNLTDNIKTLSSDNTELLAVTNNNKTTNTATLSPKHDAQKEQVLESTRDTITINHGTNGTAEKTTVDTNPEKVLEHENLQTTYGISKSTAGNITTLGLEYTKVEDNFDLNNLENGNVRSEHFVNSPEDDQWFFVSSVALSGGNYAVQEAIRVNDSSNTKYRRTKNAGVWGGWREQVTDKSVIDGLLAQKQNKIATSLSVGVSTSGGLKQLYSYPQTYTSPNAVLKTHIKSIANFADVETSEQEFNFILKINNGHQSATFTLNEYEKTKFSNIMTAYGVGNSVQINGCLFTLSDSTLTVSTEANTGSNYVITFSDII